MRIRSKLHQHAPRFFWMFHFSIPWRGKKTRWALTARNTDSYFAFTAYRDRRPVVSVGVWGLPEEEDQ